jgi:ABC-type multidrug transport system ATPase subunit
LTDSHHPRNHAHNPLGTPRLLSESPERRINSVGVRAERLGRTVRGGLELLHEISLSFRPNELVAIVGGSGAGKTTLLEALAGVRPADRGRVFLDGTDLYEDPDFFRSTVGYVPQEDIIHLDLPLERTLRYSARLRLDPSTSRAEIDRAVSDVMSTLDLTERSKVRVAALSGGQRKRASIAVELLTNPGVFFLDEPTSGLDPDTSASLLDVLRGLAHSGTTVVFTTHSVQDLSSCDRIVFLARGGYLVFVGTVNDALSNFQVDTIEEIYGRLRPDGAPEEWASRFAARHEAEIETAPRTPPHPRRSRRQPGAIRQWSILTRRTFETLLGNKLTMAILLGSPALVVTMFAILFRRDAFDFSNPSPTAVGMILFWIAFAAFFFGLTYGLLQICTEQAILRREYLVGLKLGSYLFSKIAVLFPFLLIVVIVMLAVLRVLDRLPPDDLTVYLSVGVALMLDATAALALGLLTSAAVGNPSQATLALPMLCFPAVLFSGAILPVPVMAQIGAFISALMPSRWAWEALGHDLGIRHLLAKGGSPLGPPLLDSYGDTGTYATGTYWLILGIFCVVLIAGALGTLRITNRRVAR